MRDGEYDVLASVRSWKSGEVMNGSSSSIGEEDGKMKAVIVYSNSPDGKKALVAQLDYLWWKRERGLA